MARTSRSTTATNRDDPDSNPSRGGWTPKGPAAAFSFPMSEQVSCPMVASLGGTHLGVGRFLRKRQRLRCRTARRSVPTQEALWATSQSPSANSALPEHLRGRAISPKAPCLRCRTARRSVPTSEVLGSDSESYGGLGQNDALAKEDAVSTSGPIESFSLSKKTTHSRPGNGLPSPGSRRVDHGAGIPPRPRSCPRSARCAPADTVAGFPSPSVQCGGFAD